jgi:uncharacterized membrane protein YjfL (UPF0719 family)
LIFSFFACLAGLGLLWQRMSVSKLGARRCQRVPFYSALISSFVLLWVAARSWTDKEVRQNTAYQWLTLTLGGSYLLIAFTLRRLLGIGLRDDAFERRNLAAILALSGAVIGSMLVYIGSNLGEGPSFLINIFCAALGLMTWIVLWVALEMGGGVAWSVAEERDVASGVRLGAFLIAEGLVLGRALAGNWHSVRGTVEDFGRDGWFALVLLSIAVLAEWILKPRARCPFPSWRTRGVPVAVLYLLFALAWLRYLGPWEGAP